MAGHAQTVDGGPDAARIGLGIAGFVFVPLATLDGPGTWWQPVLLTVAAGLLAAWAFWGVPLVVVGPVILVLTVLTQTDGRMEPGMFLLTLLAISITGWHDLSWATGLLLLATAAAPLMIAFVLGPPTASRAASG